MAVEVFRRTLTARLAPLLVAGGALALLTTDAVAGRLTLSWWPLIMGGIGVVAGVGALMALGDEVLVEETGIRTRNRYLRRERFVAWEEIREVRAFRGRTGMRLRALFVIPHQGPRLILDSLRSLERLETLLEAGRGRSGEHRL